MTGPIPRTAAQRNRGETVILPDRVQGDHGPMRYDLPPLGEDAALPDTVREHLGRALRARYATSAEKPQYLGDPVLPEAFSDSVRRLEGRLKAHEQGTEAVKGALEAILDLPLDETADRPR